jgi:hypothetical protein
MWDFIALKLLLIREFCPYRNFVRWMDARILWAKYCPKSTGKKLPENFSLIQNWAE